MPEPGQAQHNNGYYELRLSPGKGKGAFALRSIRAGTTILTDNALLRIKQPVDRIYDNVVKTALSRLTPAQKQQFLSLPGFPGVGPPGHPLANRFHSNMFPNKNDPEVKCFAHASRFNHSCRPNCDVDENSKGQMVCVVRENVAKDEELTFSYNAAMVFMTTSQRKSIMAQYLSEPCQCGLCLAPVYEQHVSDLRRNLLRHLIIYIHNKDLADKLPPLKKDFRTTMSQQPHAAGWRLWRGDLLVAQLAEAEGIIGAMQLGLCYVEMIGLTTFLIQKCRIFDVPPALVANMRKWVPEVRRHWHLVKQSEEDGKVGYQERVQMAVGYAEMVIEMDGVLWPLFQMSAAS